MAGSPEPGVLQNPSGLGFRRPAIAVWLAWNNKLPWHCFAAKKRGPSHLSVIAVIRTCARTTRLKKTKTDDPKI